MSSPNLMLPFIHQVLPPAFSQWNIPKEGRHLEIGLAKLPADPIASYPHSRLGKIFIRTFILRLYSQIVNAWYCQRHFRLFA